MSDTLTGQPQLSGNVLLYAQPEPLSKEQHGALGVKQLDAPFAFAATTHVAPLTVTEFGLAALSYPVIFVGETYQPVAVLGLNPNENLFAGADGQWDFDAYVPGYIRRYPFVLADDKEQERMIVCIDRKAPMITDKPEQAFFDKAGEPTDLTKNAIEFCNNFETERRRTESFVQLLRDLDLLQTREQTFTPQNADGSVGEPQRLAEFFAVSEEKLAALPADKLLELRNNGALPQIYAHLNSQLGWDRLVVKAMRRQQSAPRAANA